MTACGQEPTTSTTAAGGEIQKGGTLVYQIGNPSFIEPTQAFESEGIEIVQAVFDSLVQFDYLTNELAPDVAASWEANEDASVWTFHLSGESTFHNGRKVTAADFKYAWERICDPVNKSNISYHLSAVKGFDEMGEGAATELSGVKAIDDETLEVTLSYGYGDFEYVVGHPCLCPIPKEEVEKDAAAFALKPIGNGPFMVSEPWAASRYVRVVKYPDYKGTQPNIDGVEFKIFEDVETAYLGFQAGSIDSTQIPPGNVNAAKTAYGVSPDGYTSNPGAQVQLGPELAIYYMLLNNEAEPFDDPDVRRAVSLAINRQAICDIVHEGVRKPADSFIPPGVAGYVPEAWAYSKYDVEAAKEHLAKAGYPDGAGFPIIKLSFNSGPGHEDIMTLVQADLKAIGVTAEFDVSDAPTYWDKVQNGNYQIGRSGWGADYPIIDSFVYSNLASTSADNFANYNNPALDEVITAARQIKATDERIKKYEEAVAMAGEDCPVVPITFYAHSRVGSARLHDFVHGGLGMSDFVSCWLEGAAAQ
jgi:peptide/nickel transport system substrate-binding protein/oligopeptide transport system substrate-binding protein